MNYEQILELDSITLNDCLLLHKEGVSAEINNGRITNLVKE